MHWYERLVGDLRFALRQIPRNIGFSGVVILTLALGIGALTAVFQVADESLFHPSSYPNANRIAMLWGEDPAKPGAPNLVSAVEIQRLERGDVFTSVAGIDLKQLSFALTGVGTPRQIGAANVTSGFFDVLGVSPMFGAPLHQTDLARETGSTVVMSYRLWQDYFHGDTQAIGKTLNLDGRAYKIVAVMPRDFHFPIRYQNQDLEAWMPESLDSMLRVPGLRTAGTMLTFAAYPPGATLTQTRERLLGVEKRLVLEQPELSKSRTLSLAPLSGELAGAHRVELFLLIGAVAALLLIACLNVTNLFITRGYARGQEVAMRVSLGASRLDLLRQVVAECSVLVILGTLAAFPLALLGSRILSTYIQSEPGGAGFAHLLSPPALATHTFSIRPMLFLAGAFAAALLLSSGLPAFALSAKRRLGIANGQKRMSFGKHSRQLRVVLMISQIALTLPLAICALLLVRSFQELINRDPGFEVHHRLTYQLTLPAATYSSPALQARFYSRLLEKVRNLPGVDSAALIGGLPLTTWMKIGDFQPDTLAGAQTADLPSAQTRSTSADYFAAMGIPVLRGRTFQNGSESSTPKEVVVSRSLAAAYWPNVDATGHTLKLDGDPYTIVGVVGDVHQTSLATPTGPEYYVSFWGDPDRSMGVILNTNTSEPFMHGVFESTVHSLDPALPIAHAASYDELLRDASGPERIHLTLLSFVSGLAMLLTLVGIFGLVSYFVTQRTMELGVRLALGAGRSHIVSIVLREVLGWTALGIVGGLAIALTLAHFVSHLLFGVSAFDPAMYISACLLLVACALIASILPIVRAARIEPATILRAE